MVVVAAPYSLCIIDCVTCCDCINYYWYALHNWFSIRYSLLIAVVLTYYISRCSLLDIIARDPRAVVGDDGKHNSHTTDTITNTSPDNNEHDYSTYDNADTTTNT